jgi:predicted DNA binding CopG/RHH family protein
MSRTCKAKSATFTTGETEKGKLIAIVLVERGDRIRVVTAYTLDAGQKRATWSGGCEESEIMKKNTSEIPKFATEAEEADWWASREGRAYLKSRATNALKKGVSGSRLVAKLNRTTSVQIALRLPEPDVAKARELATRKGIGYQTLLKMLVHEGLRREERRA